MTTEDLAMKRHRPAEIDQHRGAYRALAVAIAFGWIVTTGGVALVAYLLGGVQ